MVTFELVDARNRKYTYYPEGKANGRAGYFSLSPRGKILNFTESPDDKFKDYLNMAVYEIRDALEETGELLKEGMNAWY